MSKLSYTSCNFYSLLHTNSWKLLLLHVFLHISLLKCYELNKIKHITGHSQFRNIVQGILQFLECLSVITDLFGDWSHQYGVSFLCPGNICCHGHGLMYLVQNWLLYCRSNAA